MSDPLKLIFMHKIIHCYNTSIFHLKAYLINVGLSDLIKMFHHIW